MKRFLLPAILVLAAVLILLGLPLEESSDSVTFYYARKDYAYAKDSGAFGSETREVGRRKTDLTYLLALYLDGPMDQNLKTPFPGNNIQEVQTLTIDQGTVTITLADMGVGMRDSEFTLSCACLSKTCLEISDAQKVKITSGERSVTMTRDNLIFFDESTWEEEKVTEET